MALSTYWQCYTATITTNTAVTLPSDAKSVTFQPRDAQMTLMHASGSAYITIPILGTYTIDNRNIAGAIFYLSGAGELDYAVEKGLAN